VGRLCHAGQCTIRKLKSNAVGDSSIVRAPDEPADSEADALEQPGLHGRHRDKNGELSKKHGNTLMRTLRKIYGQHFAEGCGPEEKLSDMLQKLENGRPNGLQAGGRSALPRKLFRRGFHGRIGSPRSHFQRAYLTKFRRQLLS
jgi:hypothetical protein